LLTVLATSSRVAPGLLTWQAWDLLRSADVVFAPPGHPLLPVLDEAGIAYSVVESPPAAPAPPPAPAPPDDRAVVWLAPLPALGARPESQGADVVTGSADLPGAHLLDLVATMERLRVNCPWDAKQTHQSLAPHLLEEPYEALEALEAGDMDAFRDELGDVLLQVVFHARIAEEFTVDDVADQIVAKLVRRHPHVFGDVTVADADEVKLNWDAIKRQERAERAGVLGLDPAAPSALDGVPFGQPALALAMQLQRRAARAGAPDALAELADPAELADSAELADASEPDLGADLFRLVTRARLAGVDPELELRAAARRYRDLIRYWEHSQTSAEQ
jgi:XTP/dITP diphosphohydrolase